MQKSLAIAIVSGALIIAAALVYHGKQLGDLSVRLELMEQRTNGLDARLESFSDDLPHLVEKAGDNAGRQAVHGIVDEVVNLPSKWLRGGSSQPNTGDRLPGKPADSGSSAELPWLDLDIQDPVINIDILPNLKEIPGIPWKEIIGEEERKPNPVIEVQQEEEPEAIGQP